jgi:hypothetical protein
MLTILALNPDALAILGSLENRLDSFRLFDASQDSREKESLSLSLRSVFPPIITSDGTTPNGRTQCELTADAHDMGGG